MYSTYTPLFPFGHGLSYTTFSYSDLKISKRSIGAKETLNISFEILNTGNYDGDEVAQLYVSFPDSKVERPLKALKGFKRVFIKKGESTKVTIPLKSSDLTYWDVDKQAFILESGKVKLSIGSSSAEQKLAGEVNISARE